MIPYLTEMFAGYSTINKILEDRFVACYCAVYPLVLFYGIYKNDIIRIEPIFWIHSLGENMGELE
jgi:hypothetical protein